ncbi:TlpA family protein disulfide reductase [Phycicoccus endophyticus]|uniref:TlpA family protein disulfide reductase n=1 Tax=Phycicoccus endophyticus TaxID=1690220 RepID=A0A7G9QZJ3_9MICO|nr:TlpA disulfide reductase family protein [Phycicoccus endophyticus]NHI19134.1 TlpA family protein disulfide reductase [Phycicoccus endophyticus]QNN48768.1 TlpA family protein disulfide reductase [Phycicoccus endophyticus]GGL33017.1 thiol-disulfide isomerase [Phycicoccus endophyticus]
MTPSRRVLVGLAGLAALALAGCTEDPNSVAAQAKAGDQKGYVSGDGTVETIPEAQRDEPVTMSGSLLDGTSWDIASTRGEVLVLNVWGSWCAPCVAEAPDLQKAWEQVQQEKVPAQFVGIDFREEAERGAAFAQKAGVTYPSLTDESGVLVLRLQGKAPTVPTTLVLDPKGRIAARVNGPVDTSTLTGLVDDVVAQS